MTSVIVQGELLFMAERSERRKDNLARVRAFLADIRVLDLDGPTAAAYADLKAALLAHYGPRDRARRSRFRLDKLGICENDLWIAATVIRHKLHLVSSDSDFERMRAVRSFPLENWLI